MMEKDDLGLSLSLSSSQTLRHHQPLQLNLAPSLQPSPSNLRRQPPPCTDTFAAAAFDRSSGDTKSFLRGFDVNRPPATAECEEEVAVSSPNSTLSSVSGKRSEREPCTGEDHDNERTSSRGGASDEEDGDNSRKKLRLSKEQSATLEDSFKEHNTLNPKQKMALAKQLGLRPRQVEVWFQNRRARTKLKQTEVDCEFLKRCCENLTDENRRLQKEVQELRALKLSPQIYMQMAPPTTLTMCPSCERVAVPTQPGPSHPRPMPVGPWGQPTGHMAHGSFSAIRPRS